MRHRVAGKKLNRSTAHRRALLRNLVTELLQHEAVRTTTAKAKELRRWGDRMITLGKRGTLHARRQAAAVVRRGPVVRKLFDELGPRYAARPGGYTRIVKLGVRPGDSAEIAVVELVGRGGEAEAPKRGGAKRRRTRKPDAATEPAKG
jgi:large subunit ribosomal protein L17